MVKAGSNWRIATFRPGGDPIGHLAAALDVTEVLGDAGELASTNRVLLEATLRRGSKGLVDAVMQARMPPDNNVLILVDQFEELFRFRKGQPSSRSHDDAIAFVKLLLEATQQDEVPVYVVITMRSDFVGDCIDYPGLAQAVNAGQYLVPRMTRDQLRSAITGPIAVGGGSIAQRLVLRLMNDMGDEQDQLPVLQHALMRTWDRGEIRGRRTDSIDIPDYEAVGSLRDALSMHAEEAFQEASASGDAVLSERIFKALTDTYTDPRGTRRATSLQELSAICGASVPDIVRVVEIFRRSGRSFLMPPANVALTPSSVIDLSHESLMRCWTRLAAWGEEEHSLASSYVRLAQAAKWHAQGVAGLWRSPELDIGLRWAREAAPAAAWAQRYDPEFTLAMDFLAASERVRENEVQAREKERRKKLRQTQAVALVLALLLIGASFLAVMARRERTRAEGNLVLAKHAVDESLSAAGSDQAREAAGIPEMEEFRKQLLDKAKIYYDQLTRGNSFNESLRKESAAAHVRLGDIDRLLGERAQAAAEYKTAIDHFGMLAQRYPANVEYRQLLAYAHNWLGETLRDWQEQMPAESPYSSTDIAKQYDDAIQLQQQIHMQLPLKRSYQQELARTYYNRGILRYDSKDATGAEVDFRSALAELEPLAIGAPPTTAEGPLPLQELDRVYSNLGVLLTVENRFHEAEQCFIKGIAGHEQLVETAPNNREYRLELAKFRNSFAILLLKANRRQEAVKEAQMASKLLDQLATPPPSILDEKAKTVAIEQYLLRPTLSKRSGVTETVPHP